MKSSQEIVEFIAERIGHIYMRPHMYADTSSCVDLLLHYYHELWAEIVGKASEYNDVRMEAAGKMGCGAASFPIQFAFENPEATGDEIAGYVVERWMKISQALGVPVP